jgi:hypothetical protein
MKKARNIILILISVVLLTYAAAWLQFYFRSVKYYNQAVSSIEKGDWIDGLKGKLALKEDRSGYEFQGGLQQVIGIWSSKYALPRPEIFYRAEELKDSILNEKVDIKSGEAAFQKYFRMDNKYLPEIALKLGDLYLEEGDKDSAKEWYSVVVEAFSNEPYAAEAAKERLSKLGK